MPPVAQLNVVVAPWCGFSKFQLEQLHDGGLDARLRRRGVATHVVSCAGEANDADVCAMTPRFPLWVNARSGDAIVGAIDAVAPALALAQREPSLPAVTYGELDAPTPSRAQKYVRARSIADARAKPAAIA